MLELKSYWKVDVIYWSYARGLTRRAMDRSDITNLLFLMPVAAAALLIYPALLIADDTTIASLAREDGPVENAGALAYFIASVVMLLCFLRSSRSKNRFFGRSTRSNLYFLLLSMFFFVCAGEEISWGQRIFGWNTPGAWADVNAQAETNVHNLWLFQGVNPDGSEKNELQLWLYPGRLINLLWLSYCLLLPLLYIMSNRIRGYVVAAGVPVPLLLCGVLFIASYASRKAATAAFDLSAALSSALHEAQETSIAVLFALMSLFFLLGLRQDKQVDGERVG